MIRIALTCLIIAFMLGAGSARAGEDLAPLLATIDRFTTAFASRDFAELEQIATESGTIIDSAEPYVWSGKGALLNWARDVFALYDRVHLRDIVLRGKIGNLAKITGDAAEIVMPTHVTFTLDGKKAKEDGIAVYVLHRDEGRWKIAAISWAQR